MVLRRNTNKLSNNMKVKKLLAAQSIQPDEVKRGCKYYGSETLEKLRAALAQE